MHRLTSTSEIGPAAGVAEAARIGQTRAIWLSYGVQSTTRNTGCAKQEIELRPIQIASNRKHLFGEKGERTINCDAFGALLVPGLFYGSYFTNCGGFSF